MHPETVKRGPGPRGADVPAASSKVLDFSSFFEDAARPRGLLSLRLELYRPVIYKFY
jgi:hypothetical protein